MTNGINNLEKHERDKKFHIEFSGYELALLTGIVANAETHQHYPDTQEYNDFVRNYQQMIKDSKFNVFEARH
ncbi:hypothetical protein [Streptomyces anandii]|uniref:hypothetical protein n=1 Tax=Streptomyces anandii TaxID=285454 RepID=UPI0036CA7FE0